MSCLLPFDVTLASPSDEDHHAAPGQLIRTAAEVPLPPAGAGAGRSLTRLARLPLPERLGAGFPSSPALADMQAAAAPCRYCWAGMTRQPGSWGPRTLWR